MSDLQYFLKKIMILLFTVKLCSISFAVWLFAVHQMIQLDICSVEASPLYFTCLQLVSPLINNLRQTL